MIDYHVSSFCSGGGCVEVGQLPDGAIAVRAAQAPVRETSLVFTQDEWAAFVAGVKNGEFDPA